ncbi:hypothetical protein LIER_39066 [Lithospermum erythrorhizon]|uniref:Uncharacterized protein n=1 Tax=Lithospermum erythrorhizon TaxID=34254 RepID=A0AAV3Q962_LITER
MSTFVFEEKGGFDLEVTWQKLHNFYSQLQLQYGKTKNLNYEYNDLMEEDGTREDPGISCDLCLEIATWN